jgi:tetratricopeptide (TPR) repeat protein
MSPTFDWRKRLALLGRNTALWTAIVVAVVLELIVLSVDLPNHLVAAWRGPEQQRGASHGGGPTAASSPASARSHTAADLGFVGHVAVAGSLIFLPLTILAALARLPIGRRRVQQRFIITPFQTLKTSSPWNGSAVAAVLFREVSAWGPSATGRLDGRTTTSSLPNQATVSFAGTSLPLGWIWAQVRRLVTACPDIVIEGLVEEIDQKLRVKVWTDRRPETWKLELPAEPVAKDLDDGMAWLSARILRELAPIRLAGIYWSQGNYADAIELFSSEDLSADAEIDLIKVYLEGDRPDAALNLLQQFDRRRVARQLRTELDRMLGQAHAEMGDYDAAKKSLDGDHHSIRCRLATVHAQANELDAAGGAYDLAERAAWREISSVLRQSIDSFAQLHERYQDIEGNEKVIDVLWSLQEIFAGRARLRKLRNDDPIGDYRMAREALGLIREFSPQSERAATVAEAVICKAVGQHLLEADAHNAPAAFRVAVKLYEDAIDMCKRDLETDADDLRPLSDLAWSYCGKFACLHRMVVHRESEWPPHLARAATAVAMIGRELTSGRIESVNSLLQRAAQIAGAHVPGPYAATITKAAEKFVEAMLQDMSPERLSSSTEEVEQLAIESEIAKAATDAGLSAEVIGEALRGWSPADASRKFDRTPTLYGGVVLMLNVLSKRPDVGDLLEQAYWQIDAQDMFASCRAGFIQLGQLKDRHYMAECAYGVACLASIVGDVDSAVGYLKDAINLARRNRSRSHVNRARLDEDFDAIRNDENFRSVVYEGR